MKFMGMTYGPRREKKSTWMIETDHLEATERVRQNVTEQTPGARPPDAKDLPRAKSGP